MEKLKFLLTVFLALNILILKAQVIRFEKDKLEATNVSMSAEKLQGKEAIKVIKNPEIKEVDQPTFVKIMGTNFRNGTIEVSVLSRLLPDAPELARGFIGVAFRINEDNSKFECIYIRPTNARADDQIRRNHSIQYFSFPDFPFMRTRKETPEKYESYTDMALNEWIKIKIKVNDAKAQLFINEAIQPCLIVNDLKHGADSSGEIGLWVDVGTEGYFADLKFYEQK
ncbi:MAG: hypothetical protein JNL03_01755 [Prolixibacteraceae bacterium]|nr:hypothetical protein [Prolixibacteraceae bacterium]